MTIIARRLTLAREPLMNPWTQPEPLGAIAHAVSFIEIPPFSLGQAVLPAHLYPAPVHWIGDDIANEQAEGGKAPEGKCVWLGLLANDERQLPELQPEAYSAMVQLHWMIHVIYKGRALPLAWIVRQCPQGHCPEALHIELVELVSDLIPEGTKVGFLGDGEFDGTDLQETMNDAGWLYACRTAKSTVATWEDMTFHLDLLGSSIKRGMLIELKEIQFTRDTYGPVMVLCCWAKGEVDPLYLVSNMSLVEEAIKYDQKRFRIETFFSDQKSRGFNIQKSHLEDC